VRARAVRFRFELERVYDTLVNLLLKLPPYKLAHPVLTWSVLSCSLLLLRIVLCCRPVPDPGFLECMMPILSVIAVSWPTPMCDEAARVLDMITREVLSPGWNFRRCVDVRRVRRSRCSCRPWMFSGLL
jgi:hypothetical protein